jgi:outer membrane protein assembly factor BamB
MTASVTRLMAPAIVAVVLAAAIAPHAQNREWTTANGDAQRTSWVRTDVRLTKEAVLKGEFKFLWKTKLSGEARQLHSLTQPILLDRLISHRGFKALAFVGTSSERVYAIDTDLNKLYWETVINYSSIAPPANSSPTCPGGLIAAVTRPSVAALPAFGAGRAGGGGRSGSSVGEPGRGAPSLQLAQGRGRGNDPVPAGRGAANAPAAPQGRGAPAGGLGGGATENVYVLASDGWVRALNAHNGAERYPAVPFLPANAKPSGLIMVDGVLYTSTADNCGAVPNGVYAIDLNNETPAAASWQTGGPSVAGSAGPTVGSDGTVYVATAEHSAGIAAKASQTSHPSSVVALEPRTLKVKDWFSAPGADFNASPTVIRVNDKDLVLATANDGRLYVLDAASLGGADHKTPLHVTAKYSNAGVTAGVASWEDQGTRWILAPMIQPSADRPTASRRAPEAYVPAVMPPAVPTELGPSAVYAPGAAVQTRPAGPRGGIVAFRLVDKNGAITLERAWASRDMTAPLTPVVFNGVAFAISSGEFLAPGGTVSASQRAQSSVPAVLYALDPATGKQLWSSGRTITSFARSGLSASAGQVYVVTFDNTLYAFGIPMEH